jgi:hypothetical protein
VKSGGIVTLLEPRDEMATLPPPALFEGRPDAAGKNAPTAAQGMGPGRPVGTCQRRLAKRDQWLRGGLRLAASSMASAKVLVTVSPRHDVEILEGARVVTRLQFGAGYTPNQGRMPMPRNSPNISPK